MITLQSLRSLDFITGAGLALLALMMVAYPSIPLLAAAASLADPAVLFVGASGALVRWAAGLQPAKPSGPTGLADALEPKRAGA